MIPTPTLNSVVNVLFVPKAARAYTPSPLCDTLKSFSMGALLTPNLEVKSFYIASHYRIT